MRHDTSYRCRSCFDLSVRPGVGDFTESLRQGIIAFHSHPISFRLFLKMDRPSFSNLSITEQQRMANRCRRVSAKVAYVSILLPVRFLMTQ
jgi:hypothetical protein